jgi:hypothetical protein
MVVEQPPKGVGTINDMWFGWVIDIGFPGPDRGEGGKYLLLPPGYDGPLPDGGFFVARSKTNRVLYACRGYLVNNDPKPTADLVRKTLKSYPYTVQQPPILPKAITATPSRCQSWEISHE